MSPAERKAAVVILLMVAASFFSLFYGMRLEREVGRITSMRTWAIQGAEHVALIYGNALHVLDSAGHRLSRQPLSELTLSEEPNDMDWVAGADGTIEAWFFEDTTPRIVRCSLDASAMRLVRCTQAMAGPQLKANARSVAAHLAVDTPGQRVFLADAKGHQVRVLDFAGKVLARSAEDALYFPNRLRIAPNGQLVVADNDHRRLVWMDVSKPMPDFKIQRVLSATDHPHATSGKTKVTDMAMLYDSAGQPATLWMLAVSQGQKNGQVLVYGEGLKPVARADLGKGDDPLVIEVLGRSALVGDFNGIDLYRVGMDGKFQGAWGDAELRQDLAAQRARGRHAGYFTQGGWAGFVLTVVVGFVLAFKLRKKPDPNNRLDVDAVFLGNPADFPVGGEWVLAPQPWFVRKMKRALYGTTGVCALLMGAFFYFFADAALPLVQKFPLATLLGTILPFIGVIAPQCWLTLRTVQQTLVITSSDISVRLRGKVLAAMPLHEIVASSHSLLIGHRVLFFRHQSKGALDGKWIYDEERITTGLLARLTPEQCLTQSRLQIALLRRVWRKLLVVVLLGALAMAAHIWWRWLRT